MSYQLTIDMSPIYEFLNSFMVYTTRKWMTNLDIGPEWAIRAAESLESEHHQAFQEASNWPFEDYDILFAWAIRSESGSTVPDYLFKLRNSSSLILQSEINSLVPVLTAEEANSVRNRYLPLLELWYERYFASQEQQFEGLLAEDIQEKRTLQGKMDLEALIEYATSGLVIGDTLPISEIILLPSLHFRPLNTYCFYHNLLVIQYPVELPEKNEESPPNLLLRMTRALDSAERLRILRFISEEPKSLEQIGIAFDMAEDELMHHLMLLRVAGLLRIHLDSINEEKFSIRPDGPAELHIFLEEYIQL